MAGTAEQCRINAQKSTGPRTLEGKAKVAKNRLTHGLRVENPALLPTEDYATFEGMLQGLVDQYEPDGPIEWHLVQTIAMCMVKQHRTWMAEAAIGAGQLLPPPEAPERVDPYPSTRNPIAEWAKLNESRTENHPEELKKSGLFLNW